MLLTNSVTIKWNTRYRNWYIDKGYIFTKWNDEFKVRVEDLQNGSHAEVEVKCDNINCSHPFPKFIKWEKYKKSVKEDGKYYCQKCATKLFGGESIKKTRLKHGKSFAKWGIDNLGEDFLEKYWDNKLNVVNPWEINYGTKNKVWIKCQNKDYHGSYDVRCSDFTNRGNRCPYCSNRNAKTHKLDSLGTLYPEVLELWSNKNNKSPYEYAPHSGKEVWWKCPDNKHDDYKRSIHSSNACDFRCPECQFTKGEKSIEDWLRYYNIYYVYQKEFIGLLGLGGGLLSYDFYLPKYNLLIEYQGEQHEKPIDFHGKGKKYAEKQFKIQQIHDNLKRDYAENNKIRLLEIWYWDFDNIENILNKELLILDNGGLK